MLTSLLAENNLAYRGTLKTMCEWLCVSSCSKNNTKIKQAIHSLEADGYIFCKVEGRTYHISISNKGFKDKRVVKIRKRWVEAFKHYNRTEDNKKIDSHISIDWIKILKVFVYLCTLNTGELVTMSEIASCLSISKDSAAKAVNALLECELKGLSIEKRIVKECYIDTAGKTCYRTQGTDITIGLNFKDY